MMFVGKCNQCDWRTVDSSSAIEAGMDAFVHEKETDFHHYVRVEKVEVRA